ncbi:MAG: hypothetical protein CML60_10630 [Rhodobacteraceae bacterium]|nr:hypothetical protein [Paracoccaceae bacterium]
MFLAEIITKTFNIPMEITIPVVDVSFGLPDAAGRYLEEKGADKPFIEDITATMILCLNFSKSPRKRVGRVSLHCTATSLLLIKLLKSI